MPYATLKASAARATGLKPLAAALALLAALALPAAPPVPAQTAPPPGAARGYLPPPPDAGFPTQPLQPPSRRRAAPDPEAVSGSSSRPPFTVFPAPEVPFVLDPGRLDLRVGSVEKVDQIAFPDSAARPPLEPEAGQKLVVVTLEGAVTTAPMRIPIGVMDFSAVWFLDLPRDLFGRPILERTVKTARAVALETPLGWLIDMEGAPAMALFYFMDPGPAAIKVAFMLPEEVDQFGVRFPHLAPGDATVAAARPAGERPDKK